MTESTKPWVEKYRPKKLIDVEYQEEVIRTLQKCIITNNLPHLLFYGPAGTGKTSVALSLCKELYSPEVYNNRVLELNASDERGIHVVREKIKTFASIAVSNQKYPGYASPPYKVILLDECDAMTNSAQSALRRMMEQYSKVTRFILICNYVTRIIDPITSRCAKFRFQPLPLESSISRLEKICELESMIIPKQVVTYLVDFVNGDLRKAITLLQALKLAERSDGESTVESKMKKLGEIACIVPSEFITELIDASKTSFTHIVAKVNEARKNGFGAANIFEQLMTQVLNSPWPEDSKASIMVKLGETDKKLIDGGDEYLQLTDVVCFIAKCNTK